MGQWFSMALLAVGSMAFLQVRMLFFSPPHTENEDPQHRAPDKVLAIFYILSGIMLSCSASICAEIFLKKRYDLPFYIQKTNLMFGEFIAALTMVYFSSENVRENCSWEQVQDWRQLPVIIIWFVHGWIAGLLVKRCSALAKNVSHILSALLTYFLPFVMSNDVEHCWPVTIVALLVLIAVLVFATAPPPPKRSRKSDQQKDVEDVAKPMPRARSDAAVFSLAQQAAQAAKQGTLQRIHSAESRSDLLLAAPPKRNLPSGVQEEQESRGKLQPLLEAQPLHKVVPTPVFLQSVGFLVLSFVLLDATKPILVTWAHQNKAPEERFINGTFVLVQTSLSLLVGLAIAAGPRVVICPDFTPKWQLHPEWRERIRRCLDWSSVWKQMPVAFCLCVSKLFLVMALERLDAGTVRVFGQASLPLVGVSAALFFSRRYTAQQWSSLAGITIALVAFYHVKAEVHLKHGALASPHGRRIEAVGVFMILTSIGFNCLGALLVEKFLKGHRGRTHEQKAHLLLGEIAVNAIIVAVMPQLFRDPVLRAIHSPWQRGLFAGWDRRVLICAIVWIPAGWTATMLVKRCSNLVKTVSQCTSSVLTYVFSMFPVTLVGPPLTPEPLSSPVVLLAIAVLLSALTFAGADLNKDKRRASHLMSAPPSFIVKEKGQSKAGLGVSDWKVDQSYGNFLPLAARRLNSQG